MAADFNRIYGQFRSYKVSFSVQAGESAFRFEQNAEPYVGYGIVLTQVVPSAAMGGGNWSVALLLIYTCPATEADTVQVMDEVNGKFSNNILGMTDVVDPETGETWKMEAGHNDYWRKDYANRIVGTEVFIRPEINFSPLKEF